MESFKTFYVSILFESKKIKLFKIVAFLFQFGIYTYIVE